MVLKSENISKKYFRKTGEANFFYAVKPVSISLQPGTVTVIYGRSGSGKTTLLHMLAGLLTPTEGKVRFGETDLYGLSDRELSCLRNRSLSVIPQGRSAVETLTVMENILLPGALYRAKDRREEACRWMEILDIRRLENARPAELSGGELRRMAIARTMAGKPDVIFADEPTGDLDDENTAHVLDSFRSVAAEGTAVLLVTHEMEALRIADRSFRMDAGELTETV